MKILVLGSTGFIGKHVASTLAQAGHEVMGQTRSLSKNGQMLQQLEVTPLESDPVKDDQWLEAIAHTDAVIDCIGGSAPLSALCMQLVQKAQEACKTLRHASRPKLIYVWTSGTFMHGHDHSDVQNELSAINKSPEKVAWRQAVERYLTFSTVLDAIVIRPPLLYGRSGSVLSKLFSQAQKGVITWPGQPGQRCSTLHIDDCAQAFRLAVERAPLVRGQILCVSNLQADSVDALLFRMAEVAGIEKEKITFYPPRDPFEIALANTTVVQPLYARTLLGWQPVKVGLVDGLERYYNAWQSFQ